VYDELPSVPAILGSFHMQAAPILEQEFLPLRAKLLEIAAALDRLDRADGWPEGDPRAGRIRTAVQALLAPGGDRAEQIQLVFSRQYDEAWRDKFRIANVD
jgi:hypothetical protein